MITLPSRMQEEDYLIISFLNMHTVRHTEITHWVAE